MRILSVNTGRAAPVSGRPNPSGIDKRPRAGRVSVGRFGLDGDAVVDVPNHGGEDQAVYAYSREDYVYWEAELGRPLAPGAFGENLTVEGMESGGIGVGDRFACGGLLLEATRPRIPCSTFAAHMGIDDLPARFMAALRPGVYFRVLCEGDVGAGDGFVRTPFAGAAVTMAELVENYPYRQIGDEARARYLGAPLHRRLAAYLRGEIAKP